MPEYCKAANHINKGMKSVLSSCLYSYLLIMTRRPHFKGLAHPNAVPSEPKGRTAYPGEDGPAEEARGSSRARNLGIPGEYSVS